MTKCPVCGMDVIDLARNKEGKVIGCRHCVKDESKVIPYNYRSRSDEIDESYLSRRWHFEH